ncbi:MAG: acyl-CoA synthetase [Burkholderiales bacterium]
MTAPFRAPFPIRSLVDVRRLEQTPIETAVGVDSTYALIRDVAQAFPDRPALTFLSSADTSQPAQRWTYSELLARMHQTANLLHRLGVQPGNAVAVLLPGCLAYHLALWGGGAAAIVQPLNPLLDEAHLTAMLRASGAVALLAYGAEAEAGYWSKAQRLQAAVPALRILLRVTPVDEAPQDDDFDALIAQEPADRLVSGRIIAASDIAAYFHTGGTTGAPKLARHSHGAQVFTAWASVTMQGLRETDVSINGYPLFHVAGVLPGALTSLSAGAETVIPTTALFRNRDVIANYWRLVEHTRATALSAVPTALAALMNVPIAGADISSLRMCRTGAAILPPELAARVQRTVGLAVKENLGMTEMAGISTLSPPDLEAPVGCVGFPLPYARARIVALDADGRPGSEELPAGESGMLLFKSPNLFSGYLDPAHNEGALTADGWLITGDLGWLDEGGRLHLSGRAKDLIIRAGHNIDPRMIEDVLGDHPAVALCAAVGAPDAYAGELPVAYATLRPGAQATEAELLAWTAERVGEPPARPKWLAVLDHMPVTNVGKIFKPALRLMAAQAVAEAALAAAGVSGVTLSRDETALSLGVRPVSPEQRSAVEAALAPLPLRWVWA